MVITQQKRNKSRFSIPCFRKSDKKLFIMFLRRKVNRLKIKKIVYNVSDRRILLMTVRDGWFFRLSRCLLNGLSLALKRFLESY